MKKEYRYVSIPIVACLYCPHRFHVDRLGTICDKKGMTVPYEDEIPEWCPLPRKNPEGDM